MARRIHDRDIGPVLSAAEHWIRTCLIDDGSLFSSSPLWTGELAEEERRKFVDRPDYGGDNFLTKLKGQLNDASQDAQKLMAEMLWALLLFPSNIRPSTKRHQISEIWSLSAAPLSTVQPLLSDEVLQGIGSGGTAFAVLKPNELTLLIAITEDLKRRPIEERRSILTDYDRFIAWNSQLPDYGNRQFRHMLRYFAFPDTVERMSSNRDRRSILQAFDVASKNATEKWSDKELDAALLDLRRSFENKKPDEVFDFYMPGIKDRWSQDRKVKTPTGEVTVFIPTEEDEQEEVNVLTATVSNSSDQRESIRIQAMLAEIGARLGFKIWIPRGDRSRVRDQMVQTDQASLLDELPLNYEKNTLDTIEAIDVIWLRGSAIIRAFEVEHTTAIYSGLLRMADLLALQQNMDIKLHIVAPEDRKDKVFREVRRPVFSMWDRRPLMKICTFISYDSVREIRELQHLPHMNESIVSPYEESVSTQS